MASSNPSIVQNTVIRKPLNMEIKPPANHVNDPLSQPTDMHIVIIKPSSDIDAPLRFSFYRACLKELEGNYEATSYVWGEPILSFPVLHKTDGSHVLITKSSTETTTAARPAVALG
jgi:hypothetical protein